MEPTPRRIMDDLEDIEADMQQRRQAVTPAYGWDYVVAIVLALGLAAGMVLLYGCAGSAHVGVSLTVDPGEQALDIEPKYQAALLELWREQRACVAKMEAAMKAMEYWSLINFDGTLQTSLDIVRFDANGNSWAVLQEEKDLHTYTPYGLTQLKNVKAAETIVLWDTAKRECWREP